jgi:GTPase SAR1 family protein
MRKSFRLYGSHVLRVRETNVLKEVITVPRPALAFSRAMSDLDLTLKVCVVGPCRSGKTLLCRALAEQPIIPGEYNATAAVRYRILECRLEISVFNVRVRRIQEFSRTVGVDRVKIQLWDCSGSMQYQSHWSVLSKVRYVPSTLAVFHYRNLCCISGQDVSSMRNALILFA